MRSGGVKPVTKTTKPGVKKVKKEGDRYQGVNIRLPNKTGGKEDLGEKGGPLAVPHHLVFATRKTKKGGERIVKQRNKEGRTYHQGHRPDPL